MPSPRRIAILLATIALAAAAQASPAAAQSQGIPDSGLSDQPPSGLDDGSGGRPDRGDGGQGRKRDQGSGAPAGESSPAAPRARGLPRTGTDVRVLGLTGAAVLLMGLGLRLRTADADLF